jgi:hypothetical protein
MKSEERVAEREKLDREQRYFRMAGDGALKSWGHAAALLE